MRHYYLRRGANQGDIQVNLRSIDERKRQSHEIAKEMRGPIQGDCEEMECAREKWQKFRQDPGGVNAGSGSVRAGLSAAN